MGIKNFETRALERIAEEAILAARELGNSAEVKSAEMWKKDPNVGTVELLTSEGLLTINYFKQEGEAVFCGIKEGQSKLAEELGYKLALNCNLTPSYSA